MPNSALIFGMSFEKRAEHLGSDGKLFIGPIISRREFVTREQFVGFRPPKTDKRTPSLAWRVLVERAEIDEYGKHERPGIQAKYGAVPGKTAIRFLHPPADSDHEHWSPEEVDCVLVGGVSGFASAGEERIKGKSGAARADALKEVTGIRGGDPILTYLQKAAAHFVADAAQATPLDT